MTKILFSCLVTLIAISANAQISKNSVLLGGDIGFGNSKYNYTTGTSNHEQKNTNTSVSISLGKAIKENTVVGFNVGYLGMKQSNLPVGSDTSTYTVNGYNIALFYRKYKTIVKDFYLFGQANAMYYNNTSKNEYKASPSNNSKIITNSAALSITPGLAYKIFKKTYLELSLANIVSLQYAHDNQTRNNQASVKGNSISLSTAFSNSNTLGNVGLGFRFIL